VHPPMMAEAHPVEAAETKLAVPTPKLAELVEARTEARP
jgi:hypothetical protein